MCYAASSVHPCGHAVTQWSYCPESGMVGVGTMPPDCTEKTWGNASQTSARCPLVYCSFQAGSTWTCCNCGGSDNTGGWCGHERGRWVRDDFAQRPCWIEKCEHNCCPNCIRDGEMDDTEGLYGEGYGHGEATGSTKSTKKSQKKEKSGKVTSRKSKKLSGPEDVPVPSIEVEGHGRDHETSAKRRTKEKARVSKSAKKP
ncbi:hypothetical protein QBC39DRAFT_129688 [Podospora conica]|nr:hypothetical protein QBC39DRAFT_129688 [Schizothecium conicum]